MSYFVSPRWGSSDDDPPPERLREIIAELAICDPEHPDTWLTHESGWTLTLDQSGRAYLAAPDHGAVGHLPSVSPSRALELWLLLAAGRTDELRALPWTPGRPPVDPRDEARQQAERERLLDENDRALYQALDPESGPEPCAGAGCDRLRSPLSIYCRRHQFEILRHRPCPY